MKNKISTLGLVTIMSISSASISAESSCTNDETSLEVLRSSWVDEDLAFLDGRKEVGYVFEQNVLNYRIYQEGAFLGAVRSDPFYQEEIDTANQLVSQLNTYIDLKLKEVPTRREADLVIIGVCEDGNTTGMVADNEFGDQYYLLLNGCNGVLDVEGQPVLLFLHELGHALGLEHPFDASDGDCLHADEPWGAKSTDDSVTVMAYKSSERPSGFFTDLDLATLQSIHGIAEGAPKNFLVNKPDLTGPFGVDWGMSVSSLNAAGADCTLNERNVDGFDRYECSKLIKPFSNADFFLVYAHPTQGVQRISMLGETITDDPSGIRGLERYNNYKSALAKRYGKPADTYEYQGQDLYLAADEFYECLDHSGCGSYMSIFEKDGALAMLEINSTGKKGRGWLTILYEGPQFQDALDAYEASQAAQELDSL